MTERVRLHDPPRASLLALLLRDLLAANLVRHGRWRRALAMTGDVRVEAGGMTVTLSFGPGGPAIYTGARPARPRARVRGSLEGLLGVSAGRGLARPLLRRDISVRGDVLFLLRVLPFIRAPEPADAGVERAP